MKKRDKQITKAQRVAARKTVNTNEAKPQRAPRPLELLPFQRGRSKLGIDIGRVICTADTDKPSGGSRNAHPIRAFRVSDECIAAVRALTLHFGPENTFLLSKCGTKMQQASMIMLGANKFFQRTGVLPAHALFCFLRGGVLPAGSPLCMRPMVLLDDDVDPSSPQAVGFGQAQVTLCRNLSLYVSKFAH